MGCGASQSRVEYAIPQEDYREPTWIETRAGLTAEQCIQSIKRDLEIKANLGQEEIMSVARTQTGVRDCGGTLVERVHDLAVELGISTGWDASSAELWVGGIPRQQAQDKRALDGLFAKFGDVVSLTIRYKPRTALDGDRNKSWALVTFSDVAGASRVLRSTVHVIDEDKETVELKIRPTATENELNKEHNVWGDKAVSKGKLSQIGIVYHRAAA